MGDGYNDSGWMWVDDFRPIHIFTLLALCPVIVLVLSRLSNDDEMEDW